MNKQILFFIIFFICSFAFAQNCLSIKQLSQQAKEEDKEILLYFSGSDWCKPCILLKKLVLETEEFKQIVDKKYILSPYDFPQQLNNISQEEMACREKMAEHFNAKGIFPKLVLINKEGIILKEINGYRNQKTAEILTRLTEK